MVGALPPGRSRDELVAEVERVLDVLPHDAPVLVAVSGGPDSVALLHLAADARPDLTLTVGHVRHGLRDDSIDLETVRHHARALGVPVSVAQVDVDGPGGIEAAARSARYRALHRLAAEADTTWVLVGHTADDQAETVILRAVRGTGLRGLAAMAPLRADAVGEDVIQIVRPLLRLRREDIRRFVALEGLDAVTDPMNRELRFSRVRAREEVLPALERLAPDPVGALTRLADLAREDDDQLSAEARELGAEVGRRYGPAFALRADALTELPEGMARRLVRILLDEVRADARPLDAAAVEAALSLGAGEALDVAGAQVTCGGGWLAAAPAELPASAPQPLALPGTTTWGPAGVRIHATLADRDDRGQLRLGLDLPWRPEGGSVPLAAIPPGGDPAQGEVVLPAGVVASPLTVRSREPGDRVRLAAGTRKLQDVLVDRGVPRALRDLLPVVVSQERVLWVPGVVSDAELIGAAGSPAAHLRVALA